jgi:hypothetical protein
MNARRQVAIVRNIQILEITAPLVGILKPHHAWPTAPYNNIPGHLTFKFSAGRLHSLPSRPLGLLGEFISHFKTFYTDLCNMITSREDAAFLDSRAAQLSTAYNNRDIGAALKMFIDEGLQYSDYGTSSPRSYIKPD